MLGIARPTNDELNRLLQACNQAAEVFGLPRLYTGDGGCDGDRDDDGDDDWDGDWDGDWDEDKGGDKDGAPFQARKTSLEKTNLSIFPPAKSPGKKKRNNVKLPQNTTQMYPTPTASTKPHNRRRDSDTRHEKQNSQPQDLSSSFHISIAWTLAEPLPETHALLTSDPVARFVDTDVRKLEVGFEAVKVKIGNVVSTVGLGLRPKSEIGGILG